MLRLDLKKIRKDLALTQKNFAEVFNVPQSFISQIENGKDPMPAHWIPELTRMLNIPDLSIYTLATNAQGEREVLNRLKKFFESTGLSLSRFSLQVGLTQRMVSNVFNGDGKLDLTVLLSISTGFPTFNMNWLMSGEGEMLISQGGDIDRHSERTLKLVDTIATLQDTINAKNDTIDTLLKRVKQLENQSTLK